MIAGLVALLVVIVPAIRFIVAYPGVVVLTIMEVVLTVPRAVYAAPLPALLADLFPIGVRVIGTSLGYTLGVMVFGGFVGLIVQWLIGVTGDPLVPAYYLVAATLVSMAALTVIRRRMA
jgi:MHS family proline/betaine transporter-like MFS transporter